MQWCADHGNTRYGLTVRTAHQEHGAQRQAAAKQPVEIAQARRDECLAVQAGARAWVCAGNRRWDARRNGVKIGEMEGGRGICIAECALLLSMC